ncbi:MAG: hypothetical protein ABIR33_14130 [Pyrinomonadaceae bacterium]
MGFWLKVAVISAVTAVMVFVLLGVVSWVVYFSICCEPVSQRPGSSMGENGDRIEPSGTRPRDSTTDAGKITSVFFTSWSHAGPLYPGPRDPPGYVSSSTIEFRRNLSAIREIRKDFDRDLPDEISKNSAALTAEQFERLAQTCAENDIVNEPNSTKRRSEGESLLVIEYDGEKKSISTSNIGMDTPRMKAVLDAIEALEKSVSWSKVGER